MDSESSIARKGLCEAVQIRLGRWEIHEYTYSSQVKNALDGAYMVFCGFWKKH